MEVSTSYMLVPVLGLLGYVIYCFYNLLEMYWLKPKRLEKCLRKQGYKGSPYRLRGDPYEKKLIGEALSKPIGLNENIVKRTMPHLINTVQTHGKKCFYWNGRFPRVIVTDPELIKEVMNRYSVFHKNFQNYDPIARILFSGLGALEGEPWVKRRRILGRAFHVEKLKLMLPAFHISCVEILSRWESMVSGKGSMEVEVWREIKDLTGEMLSRTLFGTRFAEAQRILEIINEIAALTMDAISSTYIPGLRFLPTKRNSRLRALDRELRGRVQVIIDQKRKAIIAGEASGDDFLGILVESNLNALKGNNKGEVLTDQDVITESRLFFFGGQETGTNLIVWTMFLLSRFPDWQQRAREEIFQVFGDKMPTYDGLNGLKTVTMILNEVLRLYCLVPEVSRVSAEDTTLGEDFIPEGVEFQMPQVLVHYDPEYWGDDVLEFKPERFAEGISKATKAQGAYFPFTLGVRVCIADNFVLLEAKMAMSLILRSFALELSPSYVHAPINRITTNPQYGVHLILRKL
ncbi:7-deoxyloganic acid hydroxylase-like [Coffea arabica]|uniref:7-deoxyloganic acid hydroxylase-like n=1 Tax=Coffea arabica TaxID=13443 RepID=A0A6P6THR5_COFAR|nr:cytochrome P450 72A13-like [Coffea arabica]